MKILSFGEIIWDVYPNKSCVGGAPLNFVAHCVLCGAECCLLSAVGDDKLGKDALAFLQQFKISQQFVAITDKQTGVCQVELDNNGVPTYNILQDVAYDYLQLDDKLLSTQFDLLAFGSLALRSNNNQNVLQQILKNNNCKKIYCDVNLRAPFFDAKTINFCLQSCHVAKISDNELPYLCKEVLCCDVLDPQTFAKQLSTKYANLQVVLVTCGASGAYAYDVAKDEVFYQQAIKANVVSTVGAGDSFGASFVTSLLQGKNLAECLLEGAKRSAYVVSMAEAIPTK